MSGKQTSPFRKPGMPSSQHFRTPPSPRKDVFTVDNLSEKIKSMEKELLTSEKSIKRLSLRKKEFERLLARSTSEVQILEKEYALLRAKELECKQKEHIRNQNINKMTKELEKMKKEEEELLLQDEEEDSKEDAAVAYFENNCLSMAKKLKLLIPGQMVETRGENCKDQIKSLENEVQNLEKELQRLRMEKESKMLPIDEMKILLAMANKENVNRSFSKK